MNNEKSPLHFSWLITLLSRFIDSLDYGFASPTTQNKVISEAFFPANLLALY